MDNLPLYLFHQGTNYRSYEYMGSHIGVKDGKSGVFFRVFAPKAKGVSVVGDFNEWDENKNQTNQKKHGISFEEAKEVFFDDDAILFDDPEHSKGEERFLIIGLIQKEKICIVSHCYRDKENTIRIISARKATKNEKKIYTDRW